MSFWELGRKIRNKRKIPNNDLCWHVFSNWNNPIIFHLNFSLKNMAGHLVWHQLQLQFIALSSLSDNTFGCRLSSLAFFISFLTFNGNTQFLAVLLSSGFSSVPSLHRYFNPWPQTDLWQAERIAVPCNANHQWYQA